MTGSDSLLHHLASRAIVVGVASDMAHKMRQRRCVVASVLSDHPSDDCLAVKPIPFTVPDLLAPPATVTIANVRTLTCRIVVPKAFMV